LPRELRTDVYRLYHVLRTLDDLVDDGCAEAQQRIDAVELWAADGWDETPETVILADLSLRHMLSSEPLLEFCQAMRHDMERVVIETEDDLERYCQRAGGAVGVMLAQLLGASHPDADRRMATLGRAVQRTNILRDIDEDLAHGRIYISRETIDRFGFPAPGAREPLFRDQIARAEALYEEGLAAIPLLARGQRGMGLCAGLYREILRQIEREGYGSNPGRVIVPAWRRRLLTAKHRLRVR
jgi:phytoene synthase